MNLNKYEHRLVSLLAVFNEIVDANESLNCKAKPVTVGTYITYILTQLNPAISNSLQKHFGMIKVVFLKINLYRPDI